MDNLEYHMMNDNNSANMQPPLPHFQRLPSTESEPDYIGAKRELISVPHHRNETTV